LSILGMDIGWGELLIILIVALLVVGPEKLPEYARKIARAIRKIQKVTTGITGDISKAINLDEEEEGKAKGMKKDLIEVKKSLEKDVADLKAELDAQAKAVSETMKASTEKASEQLEEDSQKITETLKSETSDLNTALAAQAKTISETLESGTAEVKTKLEQNTRDIANILNEQQDEIKVPPVKQTEPPVKKSRSNSGKSSARASEEVTGPTTPAKEKITAKTAAAPVEPAGEAKSA
jgi:sec-independent protein translocase protein TatB